MVGCDIWHAIPPLDREFTHERRSLPNIPRRPSCSPSPPDCEKTKALRDPGEGSHGRRRQGTQTPDWSVRSRAGKTPPPPRRKWVTERVVAPDQVEIRQSMAEPFP